MKMFRNLSIFVLAFLSILVVSFYGCQKEGVQVSPKVDGSQSLQVELRADYCGGRTRDVGSWFNQNVANTWFPSPMGTIISVGIAGKIAFQRVGTQANYIINFPSNQASTDLGLAIGNKLGDTGKESHHILSWNLRGELLVQRAAKAGFHPNDVINGLPLQKLFGSFTFHANAPKYDAYIKAIMDRYAADTRYQTPDAAYNFIACGLIPHLKNLCLQAQTHQENQYNSWVDWIIRRQGNRALLEPTTLNNQWCGWEFGTGTNTCGGIKLLTAIKGFPVN
jgi:hypothetical protein